jgi:hypothetical protein
VAAAIGKVEEPPYSDLRARQREFARSLSAAAGSSAVEAVELMTLTDRLVDNINTLRHVVIRARTGTPDRAAPAALDPRQA